MLNSQTFRNLPAAVRWGALAVAGAWLAWRIVILGMANQAVFEDEDPQAALAWYSKHPRAHLVVGVGELQKNPGDAASHLREAIEGNPAESRSYAALGQLLEKAGANEAARKAMDTASLMGPQRSDVQMDETLYWIRQGNFPRALEHWNVVLRHQPELRAQLFPYLLNGAEDPANQPAFEALLKQPVPWWSRFFIHAAGHAADVDTVRRLFNLSGKSANALPPEALAAYLTRLQKEGDWTEAWFTWLSGLSKEGLAQSGYVYNGSFELPPSNIGFDWIYLKNPASIMETATTYGATDERALHLVFRGLRVKFRHLYQYVMLPPGTYYLGGRVRPDNLKAGQGMQWALYCLGTNQPLMVTERFRGADQWTRFRSEFTVPAGCPVQMLRLELAGRIDLDYDVSGGIWFDDLAIERAGRIARE
jgi:tetratricopeptide (TPR) repeat protein